MVAASLFLGLAASVAASPISTSRSTSGLSTSKGFTLVVNVTNPETDFTPSINLNTLSTIHDGAGMAVAGIYPDSARVWYMNGTAAQVEEQKATIISDGGTPPFPNGLRIPEPEKDVSMLRVDVGTGYPGVQLPGASDAAETYLIGPGAGSYVVCLEPLEYYHGQEFLVLEYAKEGKVPKGCAEVNLLPQCAVLEPLPEGALSSHEFAQEVKCYDDVASIEW